MIEETVRRKARELEKMLREYAAENPRVEEYGYTPEGEAQHLARDIATDLLRAVEVKDLGGCPLCQS